MPDDDRIDAEVTVRLADDDPDPRMLAAARVFHAACYHEAVGQATWGTFLRHMDEAQAAADKVDPLRHPDIGIRFPALAVAVTDALDLLIGVADDHTGRVSE